MLLASHQQHNTVWVHTMSTSGPCVLTQPSPPLEASVAHVSLVVVDHGVGQHLTHRATPIIETAPLPSIKIAPQPFVGLRRMEFVDDSDDEADDEVMYHLQVSVQNQYLNWQRCRRSLQAASRCIFQQRRTQRRDNVI